jgi:carbon monoxide dehydrogenase subunit G
MRVESSFTLPVDADRAWELLTDVERVAPCVPGVQLTGTDGDRHRGQMRVKVGAVTARYDCSMRFASLDRDALVAVLEAEGRELRGQGTAAATVTAHLGDDGDGTQVELATDLSVTGRLAQFGRGVMEDVSNRLVDQFAERLQGELSAPVVGHLAQDRTEAAARATAAPGQAPAVADPEPLDLLATARGPLIRGLAVPLAALLAGLVLGLVLGRKGR